MGFLFSLFPTFSVLRIINELVFSLIFLQLFPWHTSPERNQRAVNKGLQALPILEPPLTTQNPKAIEAGPEGKPHMSFLRCLYVPTCGQLGLPLSPLCLEDTHQWQLSEVGREWGSGDVSLSLVFGYTLQFLLGCWETVLHSYPLREQPPLKVAG